MRRIFFFLGSPGRRAERSLALTDLFPVLRVLGMLMCLFAVAMLLPLGVAWSHGEAIWLVYPVAMVLTLALGLALWGSLRRYKKELQPRQIGRAHV